MFRKSLPVIAKQVKLKYRDIKPRRISSRYLNARSQAVVFKAPFPALVPCSRNYAKGKDIKKTKNPKNTKSHIYENELSEFFDVVKLMKDLNKPVDIFKLELAEHTSLRSSQGAFENLKVPFEGKNYILQDLAQIGKKSNKMYVLNMASFPQMIPAVMEVLQKSDLNVNVQQEGDRIYVPIPRTTREHREVLVRKSKLFFLKCKESIRDVQLKYIRSFKNRENLSEETRFRITNQLIALKDKHVTMAENIFKEKEAELMKSD